MSRIITLILRRFNSCSSLSLFKHYFVTIKKFELDMKKVLVTGISGFIGHQCAAELLKNGYSVKGTVSIIIHPVTIGLSELIKIIKYFKYQSAFKYSLICI